MLTFYRTRLRDREAGFTLPELLIAIVIMGIIFAIALPIFTNVIQQGKITRLRSDVSTSAANVSAYYDRYGSYPDATTFANSVAVVSKDSNNQLTFNNPNNQPQGSGYDTDVCVSGTLVDGGTTYLYSFNLAKKRLVAAACTYAIGTLPQENPE